VTSVTATVTETTTNTYCPFDTMVDPLNCGQCGNIVCSVPLDSCPFAMLTQSLVVSNGFYLHGGQMRLCQQSGHRCWVAPSSKMLRWIYNRSMRKWGLCRS
jgi:hypothetical protein